MANPIASTPAQPHLRPALRSATRRLVAGAETTRAATVWDTLWLVLHQQLTEDALLLWHYDRRDERLQLLRAAPAVLPPAELTLTGSEQLGQLANGRIEALAHVHCAMAEGPLEEALWCLGLHSAITAPLSNEHSQAHLVTCGFRQRWQLVSHHSAAFSAFIKYLRACQSVTLPAPSQRHWWGMSSQVPHLWQQSYRPSVLRTIHDLNEVLADVVEGSRPRLGADATCTVAQMHQIAHQSAELMVRLESIYWDRRPTVSMEELLSEALLLVRGAYQLCLGTWPGCLASVRARPEPQESTPAAIRHAFIDWLVREIETERQPAA